jgi:type IV secretory pathway TrbD component
VNPRTIDLLIVIAVVSVSLGVAAWIHPGAGLVVFGLAVFGIAVLFANSIPDDDSIPDDAEETT